MIEKWFDHHFSSFFMSVLREYPKYCPADHQRDRLRTLNLIKGLTEMIEKLFDHYFHHFLIAFYENIQNLHPAEHQRDRS